MQIGSLPIPLPLFLAPMAGVTDYPFRILCKEQGAAVVYSEFVSAHGVIRENTKTLDLFRFTAAERPIGIQIFGDDPEVLARAARSIVDTCAPDIIDINFGCPVPKVTKKGAGSAALKDLNLLEACAAAVVAAVPETPVTVKMRAGWDAASIIVPEAGPRLERQGIRAITLHPRTARQGYGGMADWRLIGELKAVVTIPVIGNGDVRTPDDALRLLDVTGCDGVMIGRAALGNPWIFRQVAAALQGTPVPPEPDLPEKLRLCRRHLDLLLTHRSQRTGANLMRKHFGWYLKGFPGAAAWRTRLVTAPGATEMAAILAEMLSQAQKLDVKC